MDCLFCKIAEKKIPAKLLYEDALVAAFMDINPQAPVHFLVIPKKHIPTSLEIDADDNALIGHMFQTANRIARELGVADGGFRMVMNCNKDAGQTVFHIHLHVLGGRLFAWPPG